MFEVGKAHPDNNTKSIIILKNSGLLAMEIGLGQHYKTSELLRKNGFEVIKKVKDYRNIDRCLLAKKLDNEKF